MFAYDAFVSKTEFAI